MRRPCLDRFNWISGIWRVYVRGKLYLTLINSAFMEKEFTKREQIVEVVNKLFIYTDERRWRDLLDEVFTELVLFDMASLGAGEPATLAAKQVCENWKDGFEGIDAVHHQAGTYLVTLTGDAAMVHAYAIASHYKKSATQGNTREFVGSYDLGLIFLPEKGWRINAFHYYLKYSSGNLEFR